jgi:hypothetical protein
VDAEQPSAPLASSQQQQQQPQQPYAPPVVVQQMGKEAEHMYPDIPKQ